MNALAPVSVGTAITSLPALVDRAVASLAKARTSAEVLEAREQASVIYDIAKRTARLAKAKQAHDELIAAAYRAQADALEIDAQAKRRLADEYDAAQERGEMQKAGGNRTSIIPDQNNAPSIHDIGLSSKEIHEARIVRDEETADPGIVRRTVDEALAAGEEPTRAKVRRAVADVVRPQNESPVPRFHPRSRDAVCERVKEAVVALCGLPPASEVAAYFHGTDAAIIVNDRLPGAVEWLNALVAAWEK